MNFSIVHITSRRQACHQWFVDSICNQVGNRSFPEIIFVDSILWSDGAARKYELEEIVRGRFPFTHVPPKPNVWSGPSRLTKVDCFTASNARNTGGLLATRPYVVWVDDLSVCLPGWLDNAAHAASHGYVVCGAYKKVFELTVENGNVVHHREHGGGNDCRLRLGSPGGIVPCTWGELYGCSFGVPMEAFLAINGIDELYHGMGYEDTQTGRQLARHGCKMFYNVNMMTLEDELLHGQGVPPLREDKKMNGPMDAAEVMERILADNPYSMEVNGHQIKQLRGHLLPGIDMSHVLQDLNHARSGNISLGNYQNFRALRAALAAGAPFPVPDKPTKHWPDGEPLANIRG